MKSRRDSARCTVLWGGETASVRTGELKKSGALVDGKDEVLLPPKTYHEDSARRETKGAHPEMQTSPKRSLPAIPAAPNERFGSAAPHRR